MASQSNILLIGGTGVIGKFLTAALLDAKSHFGRIALFTSPSTVESKQTLLKPWQELGLEVITGDVNRDEDVKNAYEGFDVVVSALGRNVIASQIRLLQIAEASSSVKRFYPSEYGTDIEYFPHSKDEKPHQQKLKVRAFIRENIHRLQYTYLVTGPYADLYIHESRAPGGGSFDAKEKVANLLGDGNEKISLTTMRDVGKLLVASLLHPDESKNRALVVNSFTTTPNEILTEYKRQAGGDWQVTHTPLAELKKLEEQAWERGDASATLYTLRRIWTEGGTLYEKRDNELIGAPPTDTLEKAVENAINELI